MYKRTFVSAPSGKRPWGETSSSSLLHLRSTSSSLWQRQRWLKGPFRWQLGLHHSIRMSGYPWSSWYSFNKPRIFIYIPECRMISLFLHFISLIFCCDAVDRECDIDVDSSIYKRRKRFFGKWKVSQTFGSHERDMDFHDGLDVQVLVVYYETIKWELNKRLIYECRCDERLKVKDERSTRLTFTVLCGGQEHLKIKTRLIDEKFASVMGECVFVKL